MGSEVAKLRFRTSIIGLWLAFILVISPLCLFGFTQSAENKNISKREAAIGGTVEAYHPEDHAKYDYSFKIGTTIYKGRGYLGEPLNGSRSGKPLTIYYDLSDPSKNHPYHFQEDIGGLFIYPILWIIALVFVLVAPKFLNRAVRPIRF